MEFFNVSPFAAKHLVTNDGHGRETLLVVVKATFSWHTGIELCSEQPEITVADEYWGEPNASSIKFPGELALQKRELDLVVHGCAYPARIGDRTVEAKIKFREREKQLRVFGDRVWKRAGFGYRASDPLPFEKMPVTYERCFGGSDSSTGSSPQFCAANPVGRGFASRNSALKFDDQAVPNVMGIHDSLTSPSNELQPTCFAAISPYWHPRIAYAGTYDAVWQQQVMPLLPRDFNPRYYQAAPSDQVFAEPLQSGELVRIENMTPSRVVEFEVPAQKPLISVNFGDDLLEVPALCDTLFVNCEQGSFSLIWRARVDVHDRVKDVFWICIEDCESAYVEI